MREYGAEVLPADEILSVDTDILVPAARQDVIGEDIATATKARLVVEGANMPTTQEAKQILHSRGIAVVPDFIANAGGVVSAAHSMDARYSAFTIEPADVFTMVSSKLRANSVQVLGDALSTGVMSHVAAQDLAQRRVLEAMVLRGQHPRSKMHG